MRDSSLSEYSLRFVNSAILACPNAYIDRVISPKSIEFTIRFNRFHVLIDRFECVVFVFTLAIASVNLLTNPLNALLDY